MRRRIGARYGRTTGAVRVPEHLVMFEVAIDGPPRWADHPDLGVKRQRIDAVAVGIWRRTEHLVHGFEIKCSRADLLAELRDPMKAAAGVRACDRWWLALADRSLLRDGDPLPDGWGVLAVRGRGLTVIRDAAPQPGERDGRFLAGLMQAALRAHGACRGLGYVDGYVTGHEHGKAHAQLYGRSA